VREAQHELEFSYDCFDAMYAGAGRPSIPSERLLKGTLLMALNSVRSERQFCEQLSYNLLFRWFLDRDMVEPTFDATTFTKNRERLLAHDAAGEFFRAVVEQARKAHLMSSEHFTVDGTLINAWASLESFKKKDAQDGRLLAARRPGQPDGQLPRREAKSCRFALDDRCGRPSELSAGKRDDPSRTCTRLVDSARSLVSPRPALPMSYRRTRTAAAHPCDRRSIRTPTATTRAAT